MQKQDAKQRDSNGGRKFGHRVEDGRRKASFLLRKPVADGLRIRRKRGCFADAQEEPCGEKAADPRGDGRAKRSDGPENRAVAAYFLYSKAVEQQAGRELERRVCPIVSTRQVAERHGGNAEGGVERVLRDGKVYAIEVVDEDSEAEQTRDRPPATGDAFRFRKCLAGRRWHEQVFSNSSSRDLNRNSRSFDGQSIPQEWRYSVSFRDWRNRPGAALVELCGNTESKWARFVRLPRFCR